MNNEEKLLKVQQAIHTGNETLEFLKKAKNKVHKQYAPGVTNIMGDPRSMVGNNLFSAIGKGFKVAKVGMATMDAKAQALDFQRELEKIKDIVDIKTEFDVEMIFDDFFMAGQMHDSTKPQMNKEREKQIGFAIARVGEILEELEQGYDLLK